jgi:peroxiredoxin
MFARFEESSAMTIQVGDKMPKGQFTRMGPKGPEQVSTDDLFKGKKVVLFSVPGAFTPTCSAKHLPGFVKNADALKAKGVDTIACMAVNDVFVMNAWGQSSDAAGKVEMLADGNGEYARALGLEFDAQKFGMGTRSKRFSIIVDDGIVKQINLEPPGEFGVSSAEKALEQL